MFEIGASITALSALKDVSVALINERDRQKAATIQIEFTSKLIEFQSHIQQLLGTVIEKQGLIAALEQRVRDLEAASAEQSRYVLAKLGTEREFFAYRLRPSAELVERADEVEHFVCQPCFQNGKKIVLSGNGDGYWECPICKVGAQVEPATPIQHGTSRSRTDLLAGY